MRRVFISVDSVVGCGRIGFIGCSVSRMAMPWTGGDKIETCQRP